MGGLFYGNIYHMSFENLDDKLTPERQPEVEVLEAGKVLTQEEIKEKVAEIKNAFQPYYEQIQRLREENPNRELGGYIKDGNLELLDESKWKENSVIGGSYEIERKWAKEGVLSFHTHPNHGSSVESAGDILATYVRLREVIFHEKGATLLIALKELPFETIAAIDQGAWTAGVAEQDTGGEDAYWVWKGILQDKLPVRSIKILD